MRAMAGQGLSRRGLLQAGALAGAGLMMGARPDRVLPAARAAAAGTAPAQVTDIEHVVIFMQENRSFDHYFGTYPSVRGFSDRNALPGVFAQNDPANTSTSPVGKLLPFHLGTSPGGGGECTGDITHYWTAQMQSWNHGRMDGWVAAHSGDSDQTFMGYYERSDLAYFYAVADAFTICDAYHCSALASTTSNRLYAMTAMLDPDGRYGGPVTSTISTKIAQGGIFDPGWVTYPEQLSRAGVSWKFYGNPDGDYEDNPLTLFKQYYPTNPGVDQKLAAELFERAFVPSFPGDFAADVAAGTLPSVSWVITDVTQSEHPPAAPADGEAALGLVLRALFANPGVWRKTALFYTYDENGGYFDHVPPPTAPAGTPGEYLTKGIPTDTSVNPPVAYPGPIGLGFRVPMLVISPFSRGGFVCRADPKHADPRHTFDHTSLLRFLETRFGIAVPNLTAWRRSATGDLTSAFNFAAPDFSIPSLPPALGSDPAQNPECVQQQPYPTPSVQRTPSQEPGTRPSPSGPVRRRGG
jgi:phospholipase C